MHGSLSVDFSLSKGGLQSETCLSWTNYYVLTWWRLPEWRWLTKVMRSLGGQSDICRRSRSVYVFPPLIVVVDPFASFRSLVIHTLSFLTQSPSRLKRLFTQGGVEITNSACDARLGSGKDVNLAEHEVDVYLLPREQPFLRQIAACDGTSSYSAGRSRVSCQPRVDAQMDDADSKHNEDDDELMQHFLIELVLRRVLVA